MYCDKCGVKLQPKDVFCGECGMPVAQGNIEKTIHPHPIHSHDSLYPQKQLFLQKGPIIAVIASVIIVVIIYIIIDSYSKYKQPQILSKSDAIETNNKPIKVTVNNQNCWSQDFYIDDEKFATIPAKSSQILTVKTGSHLAKACSPNTSNCASPTSVNWMGSVASFNLLPHPDCIAKESSTAPPPMVESGAIPAATNQPTSDYYVCKLNPNGDRFLSLRDGPGSNFTEITRMVDNTALSLIRSQDQWYYVKMNNGLTGWANKRWICRSR